MIARIAALLARTAVSAVLLAGCAATPFRSQSRADVRSVTADAERASAGVALDEPSPDTAVQQAAFVDAEAPPLTAPVASAESGDSPTSARPLGLHEALSLALAANPHVRVMRYLPLEMATRGDVELSQFDPILSAGGQWIDANQQAESALQAQGAGLSQFASTNFTPAGNSPNLLQLEQRYASGTRVRAGLNALYSNNTPAGQFLVVNPAYRSAMSLTLEQPLWRGVGQERNLLGVQIARSNHEQSLHEFQGEVNRTLYEVERAYWEAYRAEQDVAILAELTEQAEEIWRREDRRLQIGSGALLEVSQAHENLQTMRADLEHARRQWRHRMNLLNSQLGLPAADRQTFQLSDAPFVNDELPDLGAGLAEAGQARPELRARSQSVHASNLEVRRREDAARPDLAAVAGYSLSGLGNGLSPSMSNLGSGEFGNWTLGLTYQQTIGRRGERADIQRAELALQRAHTSLLTAREQVAHEVRDAHDAIVASREILEQQQDRTASARAHFELCARLHRDGGMDFDQYVRSHTAYATARRDEQSALVELRLAHAAWHHAIGNSSVQGRAAATAPPVIPAAPPAEVAIEAGAQSD